MACIANSLPEVAGLLCTAEAKCSLFERREAVCRMGHVEVSEMVPSAFVGFFGFPVTAAGERIFP